MSEFSLTRRPVAAAGVTVMVLATLVGCGGDSAKTHTILSDAPLKAFAASYFGYFPRVVRVHAGDNVIFKQTWTGEPHTITLGTAVKPLGDAVATAIKGSGRI